MANATIGLPERLQAYVVRNGVREPDVLRDLRAETASLPEHRMQIAPEEGMLLALLVELIGARRCLEIGTFTGYSSTAVALALPSDGRLTCLDVSEQWTSVARRAWERAGVVDRVELRLGPALDSLGQLLDDGAAGTFDFAFVDADKENYPAYYEAVLELLRPGGLVAFDNTFLGGSVADPSDESPRIAAVRALNERLHTDERVSIAVVPIADGLTLARKREAG
jgi:caffeoyl-CoA O-methyltransferase